jgi:hypothetical protein
LAKLVVTLDATNHHRPRLIIVPPTTEVHSFANRSEADQAVQALSKAGFDLRKLSLLGEGHRGALHTLRERSTGEHIGAWASVGVVWGAVFGLIASVPSVWLAAVHGHVVAALAHMLAGSVILGGIAVAVGAWTRPGKVDCESQDDSKAQVLDTYRLVIRGSAEDHAQARRVLDLDRSSELRPHDVDEAPPVDPDMVQAGASVHPFLSPSRPAGQHHTEAQEQRTGMTRASVQGSRRSG